MRKSALLGLLASAAMFENFDYPILEESNKYRKPVFKKSELNEQQRKKKAKARKKRKSSK